MDRRTLDFYESELRHLYETAWEFAQSHQRVGSRLALAPDGCGDPHVKFLLEGVAFLTARIQRQLDDAYPAFTRHLLEMVLPEATAPTPSMLVVACDPDHRLGDLQAGYSVPAGTRLQSRLGPHSDTRCTFVTAQPIELWPLSLTGFDYLGPAELARFGTAAKGAKCALRLRLKTPDGVAIADLALDRLPVFLPAAGLGHQLFEALIGHARGLVMVDPVGDAVLATAPAAAIERLGFAPEEALLPRPTRSFDGYRLLREYFAFAERFLFVAFASLASGVRRASGDGLDLVVLLDREVQAVERALDPRHAVLFATPAINLFARRAGPVPLDRHSAEQHVVVDRQHDHDYEIFRIDEVEGYGAGVERRFLPYFAAAPGAAAQGAGADGYFTIERRPRPLAHQRRLRGTGPRSTSYAGEDVYLAIVDHETKPWPEALDRLLVRCLCTNRDLPLHMPLEVGASHFTAEIGAPLAAIRRVAGPTAPGPALASGRVAWDAVRQLGLNYHSLVDAEAGGGVESLRRLLELHARRDSLDALALRAVTTERIVRPLPLPGPLTFARGQAIALTFEAGAFRAGSAFLLGAVLEAFFARYLPVNGIVETEIRTLEQGSIMRWPTRLGTLPLG